MTDYHNDFILHLSKEECEKYLQNAENSGIFCIYASIWTTALNNPINEISAAITKIKSLKTNINLKIHIEDLGFLNGNNLEGFFSQNKNIHSCGLTWNYNNALAGGAAEGGDLTEFGKTVLIKLIENNILIDLAHLNRKSFYSVFKFLKQQNENIQNKIICSHTCFNEVTRHKRNITRNQINTIIKNNGVIGLTLVPKFLTKNKTATEIDVKRHVDYFKNNFNIKYLKIGSDYYGSEEFPKGLKSYKELVEFCKKNIYCFDI